MSLLNLRFVEPSEHYLGFIEVLPLPWIPCSGGTNASPWDAKVHLYLRRGFGESSTSPPMRLVRHLSVARGQGPLGAVALLGARAPRLGPLSFVASISCSYC